MIDAASLWVIRTRDPAFTDWAAFTAWLEADPRHDAAYEAALDAHDTAGRLARMDGADASAAIVEDGPARRAWRPAWPAAAAVVLATGVSVSLLAPRHDPYEVVTRPGRQRALTLADGTRIALNGDTRLLLDRAHPRAVSLDHGEASFTVVHDDATPFTLAVGDTRVEDVGTTFNVHHGRDGTHVAVAEGSVLYDPKGTRTTLGAGAALHDPAGPGPIRISQVDPAAVGAWRRGRLVYHDTTLATVAADLARVTGQPLAVPPDLGALPFSGTIMFLGMPPAQLYGRVAALTGTRAVRDRAGWRLAPEDDAAR